MPKNYLVVGAGFVGAVIARELAEAGNHVTVIDKRNHIGGNAFDQVNGRGERIHVYGPHLFHGSKDSIAVKWLSNFTTWTRYEHRVRALLPNGSTTPLPVNRTTLEDVFHDDISSENAARTLLAEKQVDISEPKNSDEVFRKSVGDELADIFFRPYTKKMWGKPATEIEAAVGARIPVRTNRDDRYFTDDFQAMPSEGYTTMFAVILDHPLIHLKLGVNFTREAAMFFDHAFLTIPIDRYFDCQFGELPYRSIQFINSSISGDQPATTVNYTDDGPYTRQTQWDLIPNSGRSVTGLHTVTQEVPCDPKDNKDECYYPVRNTESLELYQKYVQLAEQEGNLTFCGRLGWFQYLDMVPAVTKALQTVLPHLPNGLSMVR